MRTYLQSIQYLQRFMLGASILLLMVLPLVIVFRGLSDVAYLRLYDVSHVTVFLVMLVRPLADVFIRAPWIRPLVILRKGFGVLSASIIVSIIFSKLIIDPAGYFHSFATPAYWSLDHLALLAHVADISALVLLITSNNLSKRLLGAWWKRVQRLSYLYFYASSFYVYLSFGNRALLYSMLIISSMTLLAFLLNRRRKRVPLQTVSALP